jgi:hypothetical protein
VKKIRRYSKNTVLDTAINQIIMLAMFLGVAELVCQLVGCP